MNFIATNFKDLYVIEPDIHCDSRGHFFEAFRQDEFEQIIPGVTFIQENHSFSSQKNIIRGMKFQSNPYAQCKIIRCIRGSVFDVVIDLRKESDMYLKWFSVSLSAKNRKSLFIPKGFAHGFLTLEDHTELIYKENCYYYPENEMIFRYDDKTFSIPWGDGDFILSDKDANAPAFDRHIHSFI